MRIADGVGGDVAETSVVEQTVASFEENEVLRKTASNQRRHLSSTSSLKYHMF